MNLQPLMYFQLDNVPFFRGAYLIMGVEHSITPNNMTTSFTGLRQSVNTIPVVDTATTFLNIDFSEVDEVATRLNVSNLVNEQDVLNTDFKVDNPTDNFDLSQTLFAMDLYQYLLLFFQKILILTLEHFFHYKCLIF